MNNLQRGNLIKEVNENKVINLLVEHTELTKIEISRMLNISIPTVTANINKFKKLNLVEEIESDIYTGGRKPKIVKFNPKAKVSIGVSISLNKVSFIVLNLAKQVIYKNEMVYEFTVFDNIMTKINMEIKEILNRLSISDERVLGVGISIPGIINEQLKKIEHANIGVLDVDLRKYDDLVPFRLNYDNEANLSLLAEKTYTINRQEHSYLYLSINEGLGGGIIINDTIYKGNRGRAGEFGHLILCNNEEETFESYVSPKNIVKLYNNKSTKNKINSFEEFEICVENNDDIAMELMENVVNILSIAMYNLIMSFDPAIILVGGKFSKILEKYNNQIKEKLKDKSKVSYDMNIDIIYSKVEDADLLGAALIPLFEFLTLDLTNV